MSAERGRFMARELEADALRVVVGTTTKADILALCPTANVGIGGAVDDPTSTDLRWVLVTTSTGPVPVLDGDWIVAVAGGFDVLPNARFHARFTRLDRSGAG